MALGGVGVGVVELTMKGRAYRGKDLEAFFGGCHQQFCFSEVKKNFLFGGLEMDWDFI